MKGKNLNYEEVLIFCLIKDHMFFPVFKIVTLQFNDSYNYVTN